MGKKKDLDMKRTPQRIAILDYLKDNTGHPSASDVYKAVQERFPTMSFATVYNTLETLKQGGVVNELSIDPHKKRFDPNTKPHHHLICMQCKAIHDVFAGYPLELSENAHHNYDIIGHHVDFYGVCPACGKPGKSRQK